jgi:hypothetical protein
MKDLKTMRKELKEATTLWANADEADTKAVASLLQLLKNFTTKWERNTLDEPILQLDDMNIILSPLEKEIRVEFIDRKTKNAIDRFKITTPNFVTKIKEALKNIKE